MKVKVLQTFRDINDYSKIYSIGDVAEFADERGKKIIALGLAEKAEQPKKPVEETLELQTEELTTKRNRRKE